MKSGDGQKHETSLLEEQPSPFLAFWIQVERQRGRTCGQGASGIVAGGFCPPVGVFGTHLLSLSSSSDLQDGTAGLEVNEVALGAGVAGVVEVMPPPGPLGTHLPSLGSSSGLQDGTAAEVVVTPLVGPLGMHLPSLNASSGLHVGAAGVVVTPPVGPLGTHLPSLSSSSGLHDGAAADVVVTPPVGPFGTHLPSLSSSFGPQVGGVGWFPSTVLLPIVVGGASPHFGQKVAVEVIVVVDRVEVT